MRLEEIKRIADARTKSEWKPIVADKEIWGPQSRISTWLYPTGTFHLVKGPQLANFNTPEMAQATNDSEFIAMAANNFDKLMAVVEAAKFLDDNLANWFMLKDTDSLSEICLYLRLYLKELEQD